VSISKFCAAVDELDLSTRPKRKRALPHIITALENIRDMEKEYPERVHPNFHGGKAYEDADESVSFLTDAIDALLDAY
jgi:hypothetical protein